MLAFQVCAIQIQLMEMLKAFKDITICGIKQINATINDFMAKMLTCQDVRWHLVCRTSMAPTM
jgi:hypothetical protein